jgi:hypothetical protein
MRRQTEESDNRTNPEPREYEPRMKQHQRRGREELKEVSLLIEVLSSRERERELERRTFSPNEAENVIKENEN